MKRGCEQEALRAIQNAVKLIEEAEVKRDPEIILSAYAFGVLQSTFFLLSQHCFTGELKEATHQLLSLLDQVY